MYVSGCLRATRVDAVQVAVRARMSARVHMEATASAVAHVVAGARASTQVHCDFVASEAQVVDVEFAVPSVGLSAEPNAATAMGSRVHTMQRRATPSAALACGTAAPSELGAALGVEPSARVVGARVDVL